MAPLARGTALADMARVNVLRAWGAKAVAVWERRVRVAMREVFMLVKCRAGCCDDEIVRQPSGSFWLQSRLF